MRRRLGIVILAIGVLFSCLFQGAAPAQAADKAATQQSGKSMQLKKHAFPPRTAMPARPKIENGKRYLPMGKKTRAVLPRSADEFVYIYDEDGGALGLRLVGAKPAETAAAESATNLVYTQAWSSADLSVSISNGQYKDTLILSEAPVSGTWTYEVVLDNLKPQWTDGKLQFVAVADDKPKYELGQLVATDAAGNWAPVLAALRAEDGSWWLDVTVDHDWLQSAKYPVQVDPSVYSLTEFNMPNFGGIVQRVTESDSGAVAAVDSNGSSWPVVTTDRGVSWTGEGHAPVQQTNRRLVTEGDRNYLVYVDHPDSTYSILVRYQTGTDPTWSPATAVATGLAVNPVMEASANSGRLMVSYAVGSNDVRTAISEDRGATWSFSQLSITNEIGSAKTSGLQYYQSKYYVVVEHREGSDPTSVTTCNPTCTTTYVPGTSIRVKARMFVGTSPTGPWQTTPLFDDATVLDEAPNQWNMHPNYLSQPYLVDGVLLFFDYHFVPYACASWVDGTTYYSAGQRICGRQSENNTTTNLVWELQADGSWRSFTSYAAGSLPSGSFVPTTTGGLFMQWPTAGAYARYQSYGRTLIGSFWFAQGTYWRVAEPIRGSVVNAVKSAYPMLLYTTTEGDTGAPGFDSVSANKLYTKDSVYVSASPTDNVTYGGLHFDVENYLHGSSSDPKGASVLMGPYFADGPHVIQLFVDDWNGNRSARRPLTVYVDKTAPTISITTPTMDSFLIGPVSLETNTADNLAMDKVLFYNGSTLIGTVTAAPWTLQWDTRTVGIGSYSVTATAYDKAGNTKSASVVINVADHMPVVNLVAPVSGATLKGSFPVRAEASDSVGIAKVEFLVDGTLTGQATASPYEAAVDAEKVAPSAHTLTARAYNASGATASTSISITTARDTTPPSIAITAPSAGARIQGSQMLEVQATDDVALKSVEYRLNGTAIGSATAAPWSLLWDSGTVAEGSYTLTAVAYDHAGNATTSTPVSVVVTDNIPLVSLTDPAPNTAIDSIYTLKASASDPVGITRVEFLLDDALLGQATQAPYQFVLDPGSVAPGTHQVIARAVNTDGGTATVSVPITTVVLVQGSLATAPGSASGPGGTFPLLASSEKAQSWTAVEYQLVGTSTWQTQSGSGSFTGGSAIVPWQVPVTPGSYLVRVRVKDGQNNSGVTPNVTLTLPDTPQNIAAVRDPGTGVAILRWDPSPRLGTTYRIYKATTASLVSGRANRLKVSQAEIVAVGSHLEYRDLFVQKGSTLLYWYWVQAVDSSGLEGFIATPVILPLAQ